MMLDRSLSPAALVIALSLAAPAYGEESLHFISDGNLARGYGVINEDSPERVAAFLDANPQVDTLIFVDMPGSDNDDANLILARALRARGLNTALEAHSQIASGATDLFLAGVERTAECGAVFGVHSWKAVVIEDDVRTEYTARDIPRDPNHEDHKFFIDYYIEMGVPTEFYWYTVDVAPFEGIYNMSDDEMERFNIVTQPMNCAPGEAE